MTVEEACERYMLDQKARNLAKSTRQGYASLFRQLRAHAAQIGAADLEDLDRDAMRRWRQDWTCAFSTQRRQLSQLKAFFAHAQREGWVEQSPVRGIRSPKPDSRPTIPLEPDEVRALLAASKRQPREQALILLMRYSGPGDPGRRDAQQGRHPAGWRPGAAARQDGRTDYGGPLRPW